MSIFGMPAYSYVESLKAQAIGEVRALSIENLSEPALAGVLDTIAAKHTPIFLVLEAPSVGIKRQKTVDRDDFGLQQTTTIELLEVTIPFKGDVRLLRMRPSSMSMPDIPFDVRGTSFVVTVLDDQNAGPRIERFCNSMRENFRAMKIDLEKYLATLRPALTEAARQRVNELQAERARHANLPFPVKG
jgi:hypothetical protein